MEDNQMISWKKVACFAGGVLFGTAGVSILKSNDLKKAYTHCTAAVLRCKDTVMKTGTTIRENCDDIYADALDINEKRAKEAEAKAIIDAKEKIAQAQAHLEELEAAKKADEADEADAQA
ncbi:MAG: DUF6110 family protein [Clostridium sp.]|nr:DUF6110 family protein [Clostridium sp.]